MTGVSTVRAFSDEVGLIKEARLPSRLHPLTSGSVRSAGRRLGKHHLNIGGGRTTVMEDPQVWKMLERHEKGQLLAKRLAKGERGANLEAALERLKSRARRAFGMRRD